MMLTWRTDAKASRDSRFSLILRRAINLSNEGDATKWQLHPDRRSRHVSSERKVGIRPWGHDEAAAQAGPSSGAKRATGLLAFASMTHACEAHPVFDWAERSYSHLRAARAVMAHPCPRRGARPMDSAGAPHAPAPRRRRRNRWRAGLREPRPGNHRVGPRDRGSRRQPPDPRIAGIRVRSIRRSVRAPAAWSTAVSKPVRIAPENGAFRLRRPPFGR